MKTSYQILILLFVALTLYIIRDELKPLYERARTYLVDSSQNIKIPKIVVANIAEIVDVKLDCNYSPYQKSK